MTITAKRASHLQELFAPRVWTTELFADFWSDPDLSYIPTIITDDIVGHWPGRTVQGADEYMAALTELLDLVPGLHLEVPEHTMSGNLGFSRWVMYGIGANGPFTLDGMDRTRVRDGLVCENYVFFDRAQLEAYLTGEDAHA